MRAAIHRLQRRARALGLALVCICGAAHGADQRFALLLDTDNSTATGCTVATAKGPVAGVDEVWTTVVATSAASVTVMEVDRQDCSGGVLGSPAIVSSGGWAVGMGNGVSGTGAIET